MCFNCLLLVFYSIDLSGVFQGKIQVGLSSTAESDAARKAFLVRIFYTYMHIKCIRLKNVKTEYVSSRLFSGDAKQS